MSAFSPLRQLGARADRFLWDHRGAVDITAWALPPLSGASFIAANLANLSLVTGTLAWLALPAGLLTYLFGRSFDIGRYGLPSNTRIAASLAAGIVVSAGGSYLSTAAAHSPERPAAIKYESGGLQSPAPLP